MKFMKSAVQGFDRIEREFFDIDETAGEARICLRFEKPEDIFDTNCLSKTPIFSDDFDEWLMTSFILLVETREHRSIVRGYRERFSSAEFHCGKLSEK